jgi:RNA polymerase sigma-70 factor (ECF subfamily)
MVILENMTGGDCTIGPVKLDMDLEGLMDTYSNLLLRLALVMLKDLKLAEDAVQETFISYYTSFGSYRGEASVKTYLSKILINECRQRLRMAWFRRNVLTSGTDLTAGPCADLFDSVHERISLTEALMKLDAHSREIMLLHYYNDLSVTEISEVLDKPEGTIKSRLKRGRDKLRIILQEDLKDE